MRWASAGTPGHPHTPLRSLDLRATPLLPVRQARPLERRAAGIHSAPYRPRRPACRHLLSPRPEAQPSLQALRSALLFHRQAMQRSPKNLHQDVLLRAALRESATFAITVARPAQKAYTLAVPAALGECSVARYDCSPWPSGHPHCRARPILHERWLRKAGSRIRRLFFRSLSCWFVGWLLRCFIVHCDDIRRHYGRLARTLRRLKPLKQRVELLVIGQIALFLKTEVFEHFKAWRVEICVRPMRIRKTLNKPSEQQAPQDELRIHAALIVNASARNGSEVSDDSERFQ